MSYIPASDRNLLFGILAVQMNFASRDALVAAMNAWVFDKSKSLGKILLDRGDVTPGQAEALDALIVQHLQAHGGDAERSLHALTETSSVRELLTPIEDLHVQATLAKFSPPEQVDDTRTYHAGNGKERYRILRPHARGGLGEVFVAEDTELHREVALKEIHANRAHEPASRGRFVLEAEITGGLEHPGIVPVYGLGAYADGRPYYAMRFIRGESFKDAIDRFHRHAPGAGAHQSVDFHRLLRRFVDVCNAVAYAHSRGVVHRDLKPANVMLGKFGETLVVDWGLAKAGVADSSSSSSSVTTGPNAERPLQPASASSGSAEPTKMGAALGTPGYMSPEQAAGRHDQLTAASDIYSLGSSFYFLLTGQRPYQGDDVIAQVQRGEFLPPKQLKPEVPSALDAICRKAMSLQPAERYASALDLAADVDHWLADEPVGAHREALTARIGRWARRHRTALAASVVFLASAVVALSVSTALVLGEQARTSEQKVIAENNYKLSRDQSFNIIDLIQSSEAEFAAVPALHKTRREILVLASKACGQYLEKEPNDPELRRRTAQVYRYTANVHRLTNEITAAEPLYGESIRLYEGLAKEFSNEAVHRQRVSEVLRDQAKLRSNVGRLKEAAELLERSVSIAEKLSDERPGDTNVRRVAAAGLLSLSSVEYTRGRYEEARTRALRAGDLFRQLDALPAGQRHAYDPVLLAGALSMSAVSLRELGQLDVASEAHKEPVATLTSMAKQPPTGVAQPDALYFFALCQMEQFRTASKSANVGRRENADKGLSATIKNIESLAVRFPRVGMYRESLGEAYRSRGELRTEARREQESPADHEKRLTMARADFERSAKLLEECVKESPELLGPRGELGRTYGELARLDARAQNPTAAIAWFDKAIETLAKAVQQGPDHAENVRSLNQLREERAR